MKPPVRRAKFIHKEDDTPGEQLPAIKKLSDGTLLENVHRAQPSNNTTSWEERALCAQTDPEAFYPDKGGSTREAKRVCLRCEVTAECLQYALDNDEKFGVWGGLSERERRKLKK